jgi:hypothetical protein
MARVAWDDDPSEEDRRECVAAVAMKAKYDNLHPEGWPKWRHNQGMTGREMYAALAPCLLEKYDIRKYGYVRFPNSCSDGWKYDDDDPRRTCGQK